MATFVGVVDPVQNDEGHASRHHHYAAQQEEHSPNLLYRFHRLFFHQLDIEGRRQDEDQHGSSRGTNETKDVSDSGHEDDKQIGKRQDRHGDEAVTPPAETFCWAQQVGHGTPDRENDHGDRQSDSH